MLQNNKFTQNNYLLSFGFTFEDLYKQEGLLKLNIEFEKFLKERNFEIHKLFNDLKNNPKEFSKKEESYILIETARVLEDFLANLFSIEQENSELQKKHHIHNKIYKVRREFVQKIISRKYDIESIKEIYKEVLKNLNYDENSIANLALEILHKLKITYQNLDDLEIKLADEILTFLQNEKNLNEEQKERLKQLEIYCAYALYNDVVQEFHKDGALFILPKKTDLNNLVSLKPQKIKERDGFNLTDQGFSLNRVLAESNYCIFCHNQNKDSCRFGIKEKGQENFKYDALNVELHGCPLEERISEMNFLKSEGFSIAALSVAIIDNPMIAGTGHRICNDCMKACIYQKQDPVDIPQIETKTLRDVLSLPYGFEIYSLLTRWNPLNINLQTPKENSGKKILICGLGPAGYTLAHHLLNDGHIVVAIDGLKIEPLDAEISGIDEFGNRKEFRPIKFVDEIYEPLSNRLIHGFGGVAEYGITSRFDKNFLKIIRLLLERRENFRMFGGIRFGSSITDEIAFKTYGFDHVALCIGAGRPNIIDLKNNFAKGIRMASDFLMSLQLGGAFREELFSNLQIRKPILVIGGGLTAVDTACEASAYYKIQVKKFAKKIAILGKEKIWPLLNEEEKQIAEEFLHDANVFSSFEKGCGSNALAFETEDLNPPSPLRGSFFKGGNSQFVKILYRKKIQDSPAYRLNHQELIKAFEEGVEFVENITPLEAILDEFGHIKALKTKNSQNEEKIFECKSLFVAAGTSPNLSPVIEDNLDFTIDGKYFAEIDENGKRIKSSKSVKPQEFSIFTKIDQENNKSVSFFGDLHPSFEGNVVKAMTSAKIGHKKISEILSTISNNISETHNFLNQINQEFLVTIKDIARLSNHVVEITIKAPLLAKNTEVGQIFRLQNYHALAQKKNNQILAMEGVAITALEIDKKQGLISGIVVETGGSTSLIKNFKIGEPCVFMGPSGKATEIPKNESVIFVGGGRGNQPLTALAKAFKNNGCKILFFAGYRKNSYIVRQERIEDSSDLTVFAIEEEEPNLKLKYSKNIQFRGKITEALISCASKKIKNDIDFSKIDRVFVIGNESLSYEVSRICKEELKDLINPQHIAITSLNAPMQCMLKGVCSQCLQKRYNEEKGNFEYFYACANQDQRSDLLDFKHLKWRCEQNSLSEKLTKMWIATQ